MTVATPMRDLPLPPTAAHVDWGKIAIIAETVPALLAHDAARHGARDFIVHDDDRMTYRQAADRSAAIAARLLAHGIGKDARVGLLMPNGPELVAWWLAVARVGAVAVPISTLSAGRELARIASISGMGLLVATDVYLTADLIARIEEGFGIAGSGPRIASAQAPHLRAIWLTRGTARWATPCDAVPALPLAMVAAAGALVTPADPVTIVFTSGSTADPKGVVHSHGTFVRSSQRWAASMSYVDGDRLFSSLPMFWVGGLVTGFLTMMQVGGTLVNSSGTPAEMLALIARERCTTLQVHPFLGRKLAEDPDYDRHDFGAMRAGSVLKMVPPENRPRNSNPFGFSMGMTETAGPHSMAMGVIDDEHRGAMGILGVGMEHRIVDPATGAVLPDGERGLLHLRGNTLMLGYVGRERSEIFDRDGWFDTGDICTIRDSYLFFHGRSGAMIKTAGANVAPPEVEQALLTIEGVAEAHVLGLPDEERGEIVGAIVVPRVGSVLDEGAILVAARRLLSAYKVPRKLLIAPAVPLTQTGKLDRRAATGMLLGRGGGR